MVVLNNSFVERSRILRLIDSSCRTPPSPSPQPSFFAVCAAGLLALALAMGIGRFAFTPMLPLMIRAGSADVAAGGWLAAANYAGYLLGALSTARIPLSPQRVGLLSLVAIAFSTAAMGWTDSLALWLVLRFVAGVASAWALVSTSVWCLAWLARFDRPAGPGLLYAGVGAGIAAAGLYCWRAGTAGVAPDALWLQLGALALVGLLAVARADAARRDRIGGACECRGSGAGRRRLMGPGDLLRHPRLRLHPAGHLPARAGARGGRRSGRVRRCLAGVRRGGCGLDAAGQRAAGARRPAPRARGQPCADGARLPAAGAAPVGFHRAAGRAAGGRHLHGRDHGRHAGGEGAHRWATRHAHSAA